jgi:hypothetical protein
MEVLGFDETFCPELPWPSKEKHRKAADVPTCKLMHLEEITSSVFFLNGKISQLCDFFQKMAKQPKTKKQKEAEIFVIFKDFLVIFRHKNN